MLMFTIVSLYIDEAHHANFSSLPFLNINKLLIIHIQLKECQICKKKFTRTSNLTEHIKQQHQQNGISRVKCSEHNCNSRFRLMTNFIVHCKKKHLKICRCNNNKRKPQKFCNECEKHLSSMKVRWTLTKQNSNAESNDDDGIAKDEFLAAIGLFRKPHNVLQKKNVDSGFKCLRNRYVIYTS